MTTRKTYSNFAELQSNQLKFADFVVFNFEDFHIKYVVGGHGLLEEYANRTIEKEIFKRLGLEPYSFCEQHYHLIRNDWEIIKEECPNVWPAYCENDYESITKVVLELFAKIEKFEELAETSTTLFID